VRSLVGNCCAVASRKGWQTRNAGKLLSRRVLLVEMSPASGYGAFRAVVYRMNNEPGEELDMAQQYAKLYTKALRGLEVADQR